MAKKKRQRISYVLPLASTPGGHRLGVNGLSFDGDRDILYTGGRDGVICAWNLSLDAGDSKWEEKTVSTRTTTTSTTSFRKQVQAHTNWVNDLVLVKNNLAVVSASSDASVKLWRPHSTDATTAYTIGSHSDYIKCVTIPDKNSNWVASAGLDSRICLWDLAGNGQTLEINVKKAADNVVKGSIYALKARGPVIASGGPDCVCRLWDINAGQSITKLVGHTDMIRDILISDDGDTILTASSDQTIKVWSMAEGRCLHTLTMHNDSVWSLYSDDPSLSVFYSGDKSGMVVKTDTRRAMEIDDGVSVAVLSEHESINRIAIAGNSIWTATSSSSINRWLDVDTELESETPPQSPKLEYRRSSLAQEITTDSPPSSSASSSESKPTNDVKNKPLEKLPHNALLRLSNTAPFPGRKPERSYSVTNLRKTSEVILDPELIPIIPIRNHPEETIEGQNGLMKHAMLNDKKRVLTIDTAGEVVLWDLLKCVPIKTFGRRQLDDILPLVNTAENVANWCTIDTKTGKLTVMLEENYAFDAEVYADEITVDEKIEFREDQRINLGKWILRNLFTTLLDAELVRDEVYRQSLREKSSSSIPGGIQRLGAPTRIILPPSQGATPMVSPGTLLTPRAVTGYPQTPGFSIGLATPGRPPSTSAYSPLSSSTTLSAFPEQHTNGDYLQVQQDHTIVGQALSTDYFSPSNQTHQSETPSESAPAGGTEESTILTPTSPTDEKRKGLRFGQKIADYSRKLVRTTVDPSKTTTAATEEKAEDSDRSSERGESTKIFDDNFNGVIQRIRQRYTEQVETESGPPILSGITPSLPNETPVLRPPPHTLVIIQEDDPESGGLTDLYRGEIAQLGKDINILEKVAPAWLGDLLLRNEIPLKETVKVSFVLHPFDNLLPALSNPSDGNSRLNANRMLRAKRIAAYICERIEAQPSPPPPHPLDAATATMAAAAAAADGKPLSPDQQDPTLQVDLARSLTHDEQQDNLRPEDYLELYCQGQKVDPNMTLGTLRVHIWRTGGDVVLYYKANGRKTMRLPHPAEVAGPNDGMGMQVQANNSEAR